MLIDLKGGLTLCLKKMQTSNPPTKSILTRIAAENLRDRLAAVPAITKAVVFGSRACNCHDLMSDIDIALHGDGKAIMQCMTHLRKAIDALHLPVRVDLLVYAVASRSVQNAVDAQAVILFHRASPEKETFANKLPDKPYRYTDDDALRIIHADVAMSPAW